MTAGEVRVRELHAELRDVMATAGVDRASEEARDIIAAVLDVQRYWATLNADKVLDTAVVDAARNAAHLRARGAPFAYAVGRAAFRTLTLAVDGRVLIPRQETEELVEAVLSLGLRGKAVDVCTGSGAIALSLAAEGRFDQVIGTDISVDALSVANENRQRCAAALRTPVEFRQGSALGPVIGENATLLVANPPYIADAESRELPRSVRDWEPPLALFSGTDGMGVTRAIIADAPRVLVGGGVLALEVDCRRAGLVAEALRTTHVFTDITIRLDLSGRERFVLARLQG